MQQTHVWTHRALMVHAVIMHITSHVHVLDKAGSKTVTNGGDCYERCTHMQACHGSVWITVVSDQWKPLLE